MSRLAALAALVAVALLGSVAHAQTEPRVLFRATADSQVDVFVWVDTPGGVRTDADRTRFEDLFAGTNWLWLDNDVLLIRRGADVLVASAHYRALDNANSFWVLHNRREYTLDGSADRDPNDPSRGGATLYITVEGDRANEFITARVELGLTFTQ
jgi:hypothetical protein